MSMTKDQDFSYFSQNLLRWFLLHGRKNLPWQSPKTAYRVWISEIMLQQTQVQTVIPYFNRFMTRFPDLQSLAKADIDDVLSYWSGLGYYSRARNIHKAARIIFENHHNQFPESLDEIAKLPGIGPSTSAAIASLAFNQSTAILDGNVKRVLARHFLIAGSPDKVSVQKALWELAKACMPLERAADYTQAIMDLGATCCTHKKANCSSCPLSKTCLAYKNQVVYDYPNKKIKKEKPTKKEKFLIFINPENKIYLEKRPAIGIWGGLWALPSISIEALSDNLESHLSNIYSFHRLKIKPFLSFKHSFTHFHLEIEACLIFVSEQNPVRSLPGQWYLHSEIEKLGCPTPIRFLMGKLGDCDFELNK